MKLATATDFSNILRMTHQGLGVHNVTLLLLVGLTLWRVDVGGVAVGVFAAGDTPVAELALVTELPAGQVVDVEATHVKTLEETERDTIIESLNRNNGRRKATAQELQISERTLYRKIKQYNLDK